MNGTEGSKADSVPGQRSKTKKCGPCLSERHEKEAVWYYVECDDNLCEICGNCHKKLKLAKSHRLINVEEFENDGQRFIEYMKCLKCDVHPNKEIEFHCDDHDQIFCSVCAFLEHRRCEKVTEIKSGSEQLEYFDDTPFIMIKRMKNMKQFLKNVVMQRQNYKNKLDKDFEKVLNDYKVVQKKVIEKMQQVGEKIRQKGEALQSEFSEDNDNKIEACKEILEKLDVFIHAADIVSKKEKQSEYAIVCRRIYKQLQDFKSQLDLFSAGQEVVKTVALSKTKLFEDLLTNDDFFTFVDETETNIELPSLPEKKSTYESSFKLLKEIPLSCTAWKKKHITDGCYLPDDRFILADQRSNLLLVLENDGMTFNEIKLRSKPWHVTVLNDESEIAVSFPHDKKIIIFDVNNFAEKCVIKTRCPCYAFEETCRNDIAVTFFYDDSWALAFIDRDGKESSVIIDDDEGRKFASFWYIVVSDNLIYQPCQESNAVYCFDRDGDSQFVYENDRLVCPGNIDFDVDWNLYICGIISHNIHMVDEELNGLKIFVPPGCSVPALINFSWNGEDVAVIGKVNKQSLFLYALK